MPYYECVYIARQDIAASQVDQITGQFKQVIEENCGTIGKTEYWGLKSFAYRIKKNRKGHYVLMNIDAPFPAIGEMERQMRLHEDVLRHLTIRVEQLEDGPSAMMQSRGPRDGGRRGGRDRDDRDRERDRDRDRDRSERTDRDRPAAAPA